MSTTIGQTSEPVKPFRPIQPIKANEEKDDTEVKNSELASLTKGNFRSVSSSTSPFSSTSSLSASPPLLADSDALKQPMNRPTYPKLTKPNLSPRFDETQQLPTGARFNQRNNFYQQQQQQYPKQQTSGMNRRFQIESDEQSPGKQHLKNALGVSNNEVLPLNKPIIPLEKVIKYEHNKHHKPKSAFHASNPATHFNPSKF